MKYKLSDKLNAFLTDNMLPQYKGEVEQELLNWREDFNHETINTVIFSHKTTHGFAITVTVGQSDFVVIEPLKPYVWYEREKFDGNPNKYVVLERDNRGRYDSFSTYAQGKDAFLQNNTTHFMYIEKPE